MWHDVPKLPMDQAVRIPEANLLEGKCDVSHDLKNHHLGISSACPRKQIKF